jgi:arabinogalactan oligomer/maltooligosaccharide transport system substrate-binding protein
MKQKNWPRIIGLAALAIILLGGAGFIIWRLSSGPAETAAVDESEITSEQESEGVVLPVDTNRLVIWHSQPDDSRFHNGLSAIAEYARSQMPGVQIVLESFPGEELLGAYPEAVNAGSGPDLVILSSQLIGPWVEQGILLPVGDFIQPEALEGFHWKALEGMTIDGDLYGLPLYGGLVGVYFNPSMIEEPPWDTEILFEAVSAGEGLSSFLSSSYLYGFFNAFDGSILNDQGRCILQETAGVEALYYLLELKAVGAVFDPDFAEAERKFVDREQAMLIGGSWRAAEYRELMGDDLGMVPLPIGPGDISAPLVNFTGFYINPETRNPDSTVELLHLLTGPEAGQVFNEITYLVPVRWDVQPPDPILAGFFEALEWGDLIGLRWEFNNYYGPFDEMFYSVLIEGAAPEEAITRACEWMNELNGK